MTEEIRKIISNLITVLQQLDIDLHKKKAASLFFKTLLHQNGKYLESISDLNVTDFLINSNPHLTFNDKVILKEKINLKQSMQKRRKDFIAILSTFLLSIAWKIFFVKKNDFSIIKAADVIFAIMLCYYEIHFNLETIIKKIKSILKKIKSILLKCEFKIPLDMGWQTFLPFTFSIVKSRNFVLPVLLILSNAIIPKIAFVECDLKFNLICNDDSINTKPGMKISFTNNHEPKNYTIVKVLTSPGDNFTLSETIQKRRLSDPDIKINSVVDEFGNSYRYSLLSLNNNFCLENHLWIANINIYTE